MSEQQAVYLDDTCVKCPACGAVIGHYHQVGCEVWLMVGNLTCRVIRARCVCGTEFDYMASAKRLEDLIERMKNG